MRLNAIKTTALFIIAAEALSLLGYYMPFAGSIAFFAAVVVFFILCLRKLEYGLFAIFAELFIGSFGYLFYFEHGGLKISIRTAFWIVFMSIWLAQTASDFIKKEKNKADLFKSSYALHFAALFIFIAAGLINGLLKNNALENIFFDSNAWIYFALVFPAFQILKSEDNIKTVKLIFLTCAFWICAKTIALAYIFSHDFHFFAADLYAWSRRNNLAEITQMASGFSRVFMQSHIFVLTGFFILLFHRLKTLRNKFSAVSSALVLALPLSAIAISFSRSFWFGLAAGTVFAFFATAFGLKTGFKKLAIFCAIIALSAAFGAMLAAAAVKFPFPKPSGKFDATGLLSQRASQISKEAGASSRWRLLPPLWEKIKTAPIFGQGFGAEVSYISEDPRVLSSHPKGEYSTFAFEWGWLDIWLKLGIFGLAAYLILFGKMILDCLKINSHFSLSLSAGLIAALSVNIFSPYANHPLGIGYLIAAAAIIEQLKNTKSCLR